MLENMSILKRSELPELQCSLKRLSSETTGKLYFNSAFDQIFCSYNLVSTTSPLSEFRNQTHVTARTLARPIENKVLIEVFLVED